MSMHEPTMRTRAGRAVAAVAAVAAIVPMVLTMLGAALATGCGDDGPTEVVVTIDAESTWRASATTLRVIVRGAAEGEAAFEAPARDVSLSVGAGQTYTWPVSVTVAPKGGANSRRWSVEAVATSAANEVATVRVRGSYVSGRTLRVSLLLENACEGVVCADDLTCKSGVCVDATLVTATDGGMNDLDAGVDASSDGGIPEYCPSPNVRTPDSDAGTLNVGGVAPVYPAPTSCPSLHTVGQACPSTPSPDDFCFSARAQGGMAFCRTPCSLADADGGVRNDDPICATIHPDSHCMPGLGLGSEPDISLCSLPCNPFDDVGCPSGFSCATVADSDHATFVTNCVVLDTNPRHDLEPCAVLDGRTEFSDTGCAAGYTCGYDEICAGLYPAGYACMQLCDPDPVAPRVTCPAGSLCYRLAGGAYRDSMGPIIMGRCVLQ